VITSAIGTPVANAPNHDHANAEKRLGLTSTPPLGTNYYGARGQVPVYSATDER